MPPHKPVIEPKPVYAPPDLPVPAPPVQDIVVTASKQGQPLDSYPGTAHVIDFVDSETKNMSGSTALADMLPAITSTNLGPGRNKVFIRGIADSSFTGPTQSTVGQYFGEQRLTYSAPEPELRLYDINHVEVIEGPQGTLYGAGALGGIIRVMPNAPDSQQVHASVIVGTTLTQSGAAGYDAGGMINLPLKSGNAALRVVGYSVLEGGYIDDLGGRKNVNLSRISGVRATMRLTPGRDWTIAAMGIFQNIETRDSQYAERDLPPLTHRSTLDQPHDNDFKAVNLVIEKKWDQLSLLSSTGLVQHDLSERFDATNSDGLVGVVAYDARNKIGLITHETRLSYKAEQGATWVAGISLMRSVDRIEQTLGPVGKPLPLDALRDERFDVALFGETTFPIATYWSATFGARLEHSKSAGELATASGKLFEPTAKRLRFLPTAALSWRPRPKLLTFLRYQSGFRSGGVAVSNKRPNQSTRFKSDKIQTVELGVRLGGAKVEGLGGLSVSTALSYTRWDSIQADLIDPTGLPYTTNIGQGRIIGLEANIMWRPVAAITVEAALFGNDSGLTDPAAGLVLDKSRLPSVAKLGGSLHLGWSAPLSEGLTFKIDGGMRYIGASSLGTTAPLVLEQGETIETNVTAAIDSKSWRVSLDASNILNVQGNQFSYGNPFTVALGRQVTPFRPRTIHLRFKYGF